MTTGQSYYGRWLPSGTVNTLRTQAYPSMTNLNGTLSRSRQNVSTVNGAGSFLRRMKAEKFIDHERVERILDGLCVALRSILTNCGEDGHLLSAQIDALSVDSSSQGRIYDLERQVRSIDSYLKRVAFQLNRVDDLRDQYRLNARMRQGAANMASAYGLWASTSPSLSRKSASQNMRDDLRRVGMAVTAIEKELEILMGSIRIEFKGIAGFARLAPRDAYEVVVRHAGRKVKAKVKVHSDRSQRWDTPAATVDLRLDQPIDIRASEILFFGKRKPLSQQTFDPVSFFSGKPLLLSMNLNANGSLKLQLIVTWVPFDAASAESQSNLMAKLTSNRKGRSPAMSRSALSTPNLPSRQQRSRYKSANDIASTVILPGAESRGDYMNVSYVTPSTVRGGAASAGGGDLASALRSLKPLVVRLAATFPELDQLQTVVFQWDAATKGTSAVIGGSMDKRQLRKSLGDELSSTWHADTYDESQNVFHSNGLAGHDSGIEASDESVRRAAAAAGQSVGPSERRHRQKREKRKSLGALLDAAGRPNQLQDAAAWIAAPVVSTGVGELDRALAHHLRRVVLSLKALDEVYGPLHYKEDLLLQRLEIETKSLAEMFRLTAKLRAMPSLNEILDSLGVLPAVRDVWLSAASPIGGLLVVPSAVLRKEFRKTFGHAVVTRYSNLLDKVLDRLFDILNDDGSWNSDTVSIYQLSSGLPRTSLLAYIEALAFEVWLINGLRSRNPANVKQALDRLAKATSAPPLEVLRELSLILLDANRQVSDLADAFLASLSASKRAQAAEALGCLLEHAQTETARAACRALAVIQVNECASQLEFVARCDKRAAVRAEARRSLAVFGLEAPLSPLNDEVTRI